MIKTYTYKIKPNKKVEQKFNHWVGICRYVYNVSKELKDKPWHVEGTDNGEWVLMDYVNIVVHVFQKQIREFYNIEGLWGDAKITSIQTNY